LHHHRTVTEIRRRAAVLLGQCRTQKTQLPRLAPEFAAHLTVFFPLAVMGCSLLLQEFSDAVAESSQISIKKWSCEHGVSPVIVWGRRSPAKAGVQSEIRAAIAQWQIGPFDLA